MTSGCNDLRPGEIALPFDPAERTEAGVTFIGRLHSAWQKGSAPKNLTQARERGGGTAKVLILPEYRAGLDGLEVGQTIWLLLWFDQAARTLIVQAPRHADSPRGTFALRSPVRPNPIAIEAVRILSLDVATGEIGVDATDAFDGTPVLDIKPWIERVDVPDGS